MGEISSKRFSGFSAKDVEKIAELLQAKNIRFEVFADQQLFHEQEEVWKTTGQSAGGLGNRVPFDPHHISFDIAEESLPLVDAECEALGFREIDESSEAHVDLSAEDYLCPKCDYHQFEAGLCPKHSVPLQKFSDWKEEQAKESQQSMKTGILILAAVALLIVAWKFL